MLEYYTLSKKHTCEGVEVLRYRITFPVISDSEEISVFYREIGDAAADFCSTKLTVYAEERYTDCTDPKKKFLYTPLCYELEGKVTHFDGELMFIMLRARTYQRYPRDSGTRYAAASMPNRTSSSRPPYTAFPCAGQRYSAPPSPASYAPRCSSTAA